ncbi:MAG TPA: DHHA1 domain-containing protein, partial [Planctomycetota bacterium]|nr:DHHA1 domain-containing protein [Planctomycetota bacterium]
FFYEINGGAQTKVSLRSTRNADARALAQKFGGGGHKQAAGCTLNGSIKEVREKFLEEAEKSLGV